MYYLGKKGRSFGPFTLEQIKEFRLNGQIKNYSFLWNSETKAWRPIEPPPVPPIEVDNHVEEKAPSWIGAEAVCHDFQEIVSGRLEHITDAGCDLICTDAQESPRLALDSSLLLNVFDPSSNRGINVKASLSEITRRDGVWIYHLRWSHRPSL
jgi:hypothetical protein